MIKHTDVYSEVIKKLKLEVESANASETEVEVLAISNIDERSIVGNIMLQLRSFAELHNLIYYSDVSKIGDAHRVHKYTKYF